MKKFVVCMASCFLAAFVGSVCLAQPGPADDAARAQAMRLFSASPAAFIENAGQISDPSVSVPTATAQRFTATAAAAPALEPQGLRSRA